MPISSGTQRYLQKQQLMSSHGVLQSSHGVLQSSQSKDDYLMKLAEQENAEILKENSTVNPNVAPEKGGGMDIGFGHKLTPEEDQTGVVHGIDISGGITKDDALKILEEDINIHKERVKQSVGEDKFSRLPKNLQNALVDLSFTGVLNQYPKFVNAVLKGDISTAKKESKRFYTDQEGNKVEMKRRNKFMEDLLNGNKRRIG